MPSLIRFLVMLLGFVKKSFEFGSILRAVLGTPRGRFRCVYMEHLSPKITSTEDFITAPPQLGSELQLKHNGQQGGWELQRDYEPKHPSFLDVSASCTVPAKCQDHKLKNS